MDRSAGSQNRAWAWLALAEEAAVSGGVAGPVPGARMTDDYVRSLGRLAYLWGWPLVNMHNRLSIMEMVPAPGLDRKSVV